MAKNLAVNHLPLEALPAVQTWTANCKLQTWPQGRGHVTFCGLRFAVSHEKPNVKGLYSQILQEVPYYSGIHLFVSRDWKVEKVYENISFEEWPATVNSVLAFRNPQTFKPFTRSLLDLLVLPLFFSGTTYKWEVFLVNALFRLWGVSNWGTVLQWLRNAWVPSSSFNVRLITYGPWEVSFIYQIQQNWRTWPCNHTLLFNWIPCVSIYTVVYAIISLDDSRGKSIWRHSRLN